MGVNVGRDVVRVGGLAGALLLLVACGGGTSVRVTSQQDPTVSLPGYATYAWAPRTRPQAPKVEDPAALEGSFGQSQTEAIGTQTIDWRIQSEVGAQLARRGYSLTTSRPDLLVGWTVTTREKQVDDSVMDYQRYRAEGGTQPWSTAWVRGYEEGTLVISIKLASNGRLVWQGSATAVVNPSLRDKRIPEAIAKMFENFPSRAGAAVSGS
jgi:hypothetical protein